jgi:hypothetical protein
MQVELLSEGGYGGITACIGKVFTTMNDGNSNSSVRIDVPQLEAAGFISDGSVTTSLYFFDWEVRRID